MQKVINVLAVLSFVGTAGIIGGGTVVYLRRDAIIEQVKENVAKAATEAIEPMTGPDEVTPDEGQV